MNSLQGNNYVLHYLFDLVGCRRGPIQCCTERFHGWAGCDHLLIRRRVGNEIGHFSFEGRLMEAPLHLNFVRKQGQINGALS